MKYKDSRCTEANNNKFCLESTETYCCLHSKNMLLDASARSVALARLPVYSSAL